MSQWLENDPCPTAGHVHRLHMYPRDHEEIQWWIFCSFTGFVIFPLWSDISVLLRLLFFSLICIYSAQRHVVCCCYRIHFAAGWNHTREQAPVHPELQMEWHFTGKYCKVTQKEPELIHNVVLWFSTVVFNCFPFLGPIFYISSTGEKKSFNALIMPCNAPHNALYDLIKNCNHSYSTL